MLPHEKALVERLKNEPFALIGVNTDGSKELYREQAKKHGVTWRSAWDGSTSGPICSKWGIEGFPTLFLIDAKGVIRKEWVGSPEEDVLDQEIDKLVAEAKSK